jgi:hypothetical protein
MFKLDNAFLEELGLGSLPPVEKNKMLAHIYETLEMRVGMKLAEQMSNEQLDEFESFINAKDEAGALKWLESNFPNYKQVVAEELDKLKAEISQVAPQIVAQSQENAAANQAAQPLQQPQPQQPNPAMNNQGSAPQPQQQPLQPVTPQQQQPMQQPAQQPLEQQQQGPAVEPQQPNTQQQPPQQPYTPPPAPQPWTPDQN